MSDELIELPEGWDYTTIIEAVEIIDYRGRTPPFSDKGIPHLRSSNIKEGKIVWEGLRYVSEETYQSYMIRGLPQKGDVLFTTEAPLGEVALAPDLKFSLAQRMMLLRPNQKLLESKFLLYQIKNDEFQSKLRISGTGSTVTGVSSRNFQPLELLVAPLNEQKRIVAKIEELNDRTQRAKEALETIPQLCDRFRQSVLAAAFRGDLTADWREQNPDVEPASVLLEKVRALQQLELSKANSDISDLPALSNNWTWIDLGTLGKVSGGLTKNSKREDLPLEFPYLRVANVYADYLELNEIKTIKIREEEYERVALKNRDLLIVEGNGSLDQIGRVCIWDGSISPCLHQNHLIKVRFTPIQLGDYVLLWLLSDEGRKQILKVASSTTGLHTLSLSKVSALKIPLAPLSEQQEIVLQVRKILKAVDLIYRQYSVATKQLNRLNQSILAKAFRGELVPQDPDDEPASVLLERIRAEREKLNNGKQKSQRTSKRKSKTVEEQGV
jgi:type I restriction enzyme, S subunit